MSDPTTAARAPGPCPGCARIYSAGEVGRWREIAAKAGDQAELRETALRCPACRTPAEHALECAAGSIRCVRCECWCHPQHEREIRQTVELAALAAMDAPARWFYAPSDCAEQWRFGGESRDDAIAEALADDDLRLCDLEAFWVVAENEEHRRPWAYWRAVASAIAHGLDYADEILAEESLVDCEDGFLAGDRVSEAEIVDAIAFGLMARLERPAWRCVGRNPERIAFADVEGGES